MKITLQPLDFTESAVRTSVRDIENSGKQVDVVLITNKQDGQTLSVSANSKKTPVVFNEIPADGLVHSFSAKVVFQKKIIKGPLVPKEWRFEGDNS